MLKLKNVSFAYNQEPVLKNVSFSISKGENFSLIGESGCGKSTLLQLIYGMYDAEGIISWNTNRILGPKFNLVPGEPYIKYLAQNFDLMLPLSVEDNVGKFLSNMYPIKKKRRIKALLEVVEMEEFSKVKAANLSGGQQQRVALARALAKEPELLLLDEPFSHINHFRKNNLRRKLFSYLKEKNITCLLATHESTDALSFADQTIVLKNGKIHAQAAPQLLYQNPKNKYVASLFGDVNEISLKSLIPSEKSRKKILLYPHEIQAGKKSEIRAQVRNSYFKGANFLTEAIFKGQSIFFDHPTELSAGATVFLKVSPELIRQRIKN